MTTVNKSNMPALLKALDDRRTGLVMRCFVLLFNAVFQLNVRHHMDEDW